MEEDESEDDDYLPGSVEELEDSVEESMASGDDLAFPHPPSHYEVALRDAVEMGLAPHAARKYAEQCVQNANEVGEWATHLDDPAGTSQRRQVGHQQGEGRLTRQRRSAASADNNTKGPTRAVPKTDRGRERDLPVQVRSPPDQPSDGSGELRPAKHARRSECSDHNGKKGGKLTSAPAPEPQRKPASRMDRVPPASKVSGGEKAREQEKSHEATSDKK